MIISWDEYFMGVAELAKLRSKDPSCQVGACIVKDMKIVGVGYNGLTYGMEDKPEFWDMKPRKLELVVHAETNAILNSQGSLKGATLYVTKFPCNECAKQVIQAGITEIVVYPDEVPEDIRTRVKWHYNATLTMCKAAKVNIRYMPRIDLEISTK